MVTNIDELKVIHLGDIHLGKNPIQTANTIAGLDAMLKQELPTTDVLFINGDLFDGPLSLRSPCTIAILTWMHHLLVRCAQYKTTLRVMEGTPSHDDKQTRYFHLLMATGDIDVDFKYINKIDIEYISRINRHVLYIPDEVRLECVQIEDNVTELLRVHNLDKVDMAVMHGCFDYQLRGDMSLKHAHRSEFYKAIVKENVFISHIHTHSQNGLIVAPGSFDRLSHGEEEAKGYIRCLLTKDTTKWEFVPNPLARVFKTISVKAKEIDKILQQLDKAVADLPVDACVRISANSDNPVFTVFKDLVLRYDRHHLSKKPILNKTSPVSKATTIDVKPVQLTESNLGSLLSERLVDKYSDSHGIEFINECGAQLEKVMENV